MQIFSKRMKSPYLLGILASMFFLLILVACKKEVDDGAEEATLAADGEVFIDVLNADDFLSFDLAVTTGEGYISFEESTETYDNSSASIALTIPSTGWSGGVFVDATGRNLTSYNVLTFYAKGSADATLNEVGFGNDNAGDITYNVTLSNVAITTSWQKFYVPIPEASKLTVQKGLFYYAEGEESAYTLYLDNIQFENVGDIAFVEASINGGDDEDVTTYVDGEVQIEDFSVTISDPDVNDVTVSTTASYFTFSSSDESVATVSDEGLITALAVGSATITATLGENDVVGSYAVTVQEGEPTSFAFPINFDDATLSYTDDLLDGASFAVVDNPQMSGIHSENTKVGAITNGGYAWEGIRLVMDDAIDFSTDKGVKMKIYSTDAISFLLKFESGLNDAANVENTITHGGTGWEEHTFELNSSGQYQDLVLFADGSGTTAGTFYIDDIEQVAVEVDDTPESAPTDAPTAPTIASADVISLFSDAYTDISVDTWRTNWSVGTLEDAVIATNNVKKYSGINYVGIETTASTVDLSSMTHLHIDFWSSDATQFRIKLVDFGANGFYDGGDDTEHELTYDSPTQGEWISYDIPLSDFTGLTNKTSLAQYILSAQPAGSATIYIDNFYFYAE